MKLFPLLAAAALTLGAAPAQAIDVGALIDVATLQTRNGEYARACKTMTFVEGEAAKQGVSATNQATIRDLAAKACKLAAATPKKAGAMWSTSAPGAKLLPKALN